jgi:chemotaxis response regulator CheB
MVQLAIIEDNVEYRNTLSKILQRNKDIVVIHEMDNCMEMIPHFEVTLPDLVIMDIDLPGNELLKVFGDSNKNGQM